MNIIVSSDTILGIFFLFQFGIGFIGNTLLLMLNINTLFQPSSKKPIDLICTHLTLANIMTILSSVIPEIINAFGVRNFLDDIGCKAVLYIYRVTRGVSLCTTSFLSIFQAIIITPSNSRWAWLKPKVSTYLFPAFFSFWIINMLIYVRVIITAVGPYNISEVGQVYSLTYCSGREPDKLQEAAFLGGMVLRDILCICLMIWTSIYMVNFLFIHRKTVQHVHRTSLCPRPSPETRATHTILALVSCFVFFYWTNTCLTIYIIYRHNVQSLENITIFLSSCYPAICPFVLIKNNNRRSFLNCNFAKTRKSSPQSMSLRGLNALTNFFDTRAM
ncbi:vomeronasal type-1 receptor 4-like [Acinonyx jubatus]|uniref:Vomeronasal type-1 receptor n=1 Tax=Acinonyx jubatus TaxID=32536 RepID=A0A6I9ZM61_ACIJB|nr:vomeronasal type-1 receptor 4-like [Acinonyx jubatus]